MLGRYDYFPENVHYVTFLSSVSHVDKIQQTAIKAILKLNSRSSENRKQIASVSDLIVTMEFGIAEGTDFTFVDIEEKDRIQKTIKVSPFQTMDFICAIRYQKSIGNKKSSLRGDYHMIRLVFGKKSLEARAFHERGPRRITPEEIVDLIVDEINDHGKKKLLKPLETDF